LITQQFLKGRTLGVLFFSLVFSIHVAAQSGLVMENVGGKVWMVSGGGYANVSILAGDGRALLVDSKKPEHGDEIRAMARQLSGGDVQFLINTHEHPDHTDGNKSFGDLGVIIIAHEDVRRVLMAGQRGGPPAPAAAVPVLTIPDGGEMTLHFDGETVHIMHLTPAHSPSNLMVYFEQSNVMHIGDFFSPERYPVVAGGTVAGFIEDDEKILAMSDANTRFIPGNGVATGRDGLESYLAMVKTVKARVARLIAQGKSQEEVIAAKPTAEFDATWGDPGRFLPVLYQELSTP
jgi:glyoxylase-like metal-dependent hydrolase (beta-lactamase superfamily II)